MIETAILALLAALGILLVFGSLLGWLMLPVRGSGFCLIHAEEDSLPQIRGLRFLVCSGLLRLPLYVMDHTADGRYTALFAHDPYVILLPFGEWEELLDTERLERACGK